MIDGALVGAPLAGSYRVGEAVEDFELPTLAGGTWRLSDVRGSPVLIFFTATWCPYCGAEAPYLEREIWQRYRHRGLRVICIDVKEGAHAMGPFVERYGWTFPVLLDDEGRSRSASRRSRRVSLPRWRSSTPTSSSTARGWWSTATS